jgi:hypothetical protein
MLPPEAPQREVMRVAHDRARGIDQASARSDPAVAELAVLAGGEGEAGVESPARAEQRGGRGEVVRSEEAVLIRVAGLPFVEIVEQELGGGGVGVVASAFTVYPPMSWSAPGDACSASARSQPASGAQSSSVKARYSPRARAAPVLRAAAGPACGWESSVTSSPAGAPSVEAPPPSSTTMTSKRSDG